MSRFFSCTWVSRIAPCTYDIPYYRLQQYIPQKKVILDVLKKKWYKEAEWTSRPDLCDGLARLFFIRAKSDDPSGGIEKGTLWLKFQLIENSHLIACFIEVGFGYILILNLLSTAPSYRGFSQIQLSIQLSWWRELKSCLTFGRLATTSLSMSRTRGICSHKE